MIDSTHSQAFFTIIYLNEFILPIVASLPFNVERFLFIIAIIIIIIIPKASMHPTPHNDKTVAWLSTHDG